MDVAAEKNEAAGYRTKECPRCGARLYADMEVCYGCLYDFSREASAGRARVTLPTEAVDEDATLDLSGARAGQSTERVGMLMRTPSVDVWMEVPEQGVVIGREPGNDVVLHSRAVSRSHLRLVPTPDGMEASDLGATNPTRYQGRDLRETVVVPYGDTIDVCGCAFTMTGPLSASAALDEREAYEIGEPYDLREEPVPHKAREVPELRVPKL